MEDIKVAHAIRHKRGEKHSICSHTYINGVSHSLPPTLPDTIVPIHQLLRSAKPNIFAPAFPRNPPLVVIMLMKTLPSLTFMGFSIAPMGFAYPSSEGSSESSLLFKRAGTTSQLGDFTGSTSSYPDGSGTYVDSEDQGTYASGVKCWTDVVSTLPHQFCFARLSQSLSVPHLNSHCYPNPTSEMRDRKPPWQFRRQEVGLTGSSSTSRTNTKLKIGYP